MGGWWTTLGDVAEVFCFVCKDGGDVRVCDYRNCLKSYHPACVGREGDFLESDEKFVCDWHKCAKCGSDALYLCLCCPSSSTCGDCFGKVDFVPVKQSEGLSMGFCRSCFDMAVVTEKDDDEEAMVVFGGTPENYKILFKDYWTVLNDKEHLKLLDLQTASIRHKRSLKCREGKDSDEYHKPLGDNDGVGPDEYHKPLGDNDGFRLDEYHKPLGDNDGAEPSSLLETMEKSNEVQVTLKRKKAETKTYVGWGSKELTEFLSCIGRDTSKPLEHFKVTDVVKEYIRQKNLVHDKKKKTVMCDENLHSLFNKRKVKYNMIHSLLETHFSANAISEDESDKSGDYNGYTVKRKPRNSLEAKTPKSVSRIDPIIPKSVSGINKKCLAALNQNNLNLIYLRRTLVVKLLTELDTFQQKVVGCLVRVKNDLKSYTYQMTKKYYQIGLVTGIKKSSQEYKIKDTHTEVLLCVSSMWDDVKISMLSEEDIEEDEFNDLLLSAKKENFKRPTVAELEEKEASVRADIVNHWVDKELTRLEKELARAREKGWRQDIHDLSCKKMLLSTPDERQRRLDTIPEVIPDAEEESKETEIESAAGNPFQGNQDATEYLGGSMNVITKELREGVTQPADPLEVGIDESPEGASLRPDAACEVTFEAASKALCNGGTPGPRMYTPLNTSQVAVIDIDNQGDENGSSHHNSGDKEYIIDLVSDDDEDLHIEQHEPERVTCGAPEATNGIAADAHHPPEAVNGTAAHAHHGPEAVNGVTVPTVLASKHLDVLACSTSQAMAEGVARPHETLNGIGESVHVWYYMDPQGQEHGAYSTAQMRAWQPFFPEGFRVWKAGQSRHRAILLTDALRLQ